METENYQINGITWFINKIPKVAGFYWWKRDFASPPEIVRYLSDLEMWERCGSDTPYFEPEESGLWGPKVELRGN